MTKRTIVRSIRGKGRPLTAHHRSCVSCVAISIRFSSSRAIAQEKSSLSSPNLQTFKVLFISPAPSALPHQQCPSFVLRPICWQMDRRFFVSVSVPRRRLFVSRASDADRRSRHSLAPKAPGYVNTVLSTVKSDFRKRLQPDVFICVLSCQKALSPVSLQSNG